MLRFRCSLPISHAFPHSSFVFFIHTYTALLLTCFCLLMRSTLTHAQHAYSYMLTHAQHAYSYTILHSLIAQYIRTGWTL